MLLHPQILILQLAPHTMRAPFSSHAIITIPSPSLIPTSYSFCNKVLGTGLNLPGSLAPGPMHASGHEACNLLVGLRRGVWARCEQHTWGWPSTHLIEGIGTGRPLAPGLGDPCLQPSALTGERGCCKAVTETPFIVVPRPLALSCVGLHILLRSQAVWPDTPEPSFPSPTCFHPILALPPPISWSFQWRFRRK